MQILSVTNTTRRLLPIGIISMLLLFAGLIPLTSTTLASAHKSKISKSDLGVTSTSNLKSAGNKIGNLAVAPTSVRFGNTITCSPMVACFGTNGNDIINAGAGEQVFALDGNDILYGALNNQLYAGAGNDIIECSSGHCIADGGSGDDVLLGGLSPAFLTGGNGDDKLYAGPGDTTMVGGNGADHFDCPLSVSGLSRSIVLDYNPSQGDTISGMCKIVNTIGSANSNNNIPGATLPDTGNTATSSSTNPAVLSGTP
jgi:hypothetical protein